MTKSSIHITKCALLLAVLFLALSTTVIAQTQAGSTPAKKKEYVYLLHANETRYNKNINADAQILVGNVSFRHDSLYMYCDSALFYEATNSLQAFGQVHLVQGDTLFLDGEELFYDGDAMLAEMRYNVRMRDPRMTLTTDSLNYDRTLNLGYYFDWGTLKDSINTLTSQWGEYDTKTKDALFNYDVTLTNDNFVLTSDTLGYNTTTRIATITGPSNIDSDNNHIYTTLGFYYTNEDQAKLSERPVLSNDDNRLVGDSLFYDRLNGYGEAFMNVVLDDYKDKCRLKGDYVYYNELCDSAYATQRAIAIDYSQGDSLFIHADTLSLATYHTLMPTLDADSLLTDSTEAAIQAAIADTTQNTSTANVSLDALASTIDKAVALNRSVPTDSIPADSLQPEGISNAMDSLSNDTLAADSISTDSIPSQSALTGMTEDATSLFINLDSLIQAREAAADSISHAERDSLANEVPAPVDSIYRIIRGYHKVRMYRSDIQAVCDSLVFCTRDSCLTMYYDPIIWNGAQQVLGETIKVYMNDSTINWVHIENQALMVEQLDTIHFNQISGREIKAYFKDGKIEHTDVVGNVLVVYYYQEDNDSVLIGMNTTEASMLTAYMVDQQVDKLLITNKSNGTFYPMLQIPENKMKLSTFGWFHQLRPLSPADIMIWRGKNSEEKLKKSKRSAVPLPSLKGVTQ